MRGVDTAADILVLAILGITALLLLLGYGASAIVALALANSTFLGALTATAALSSRAFSPRL